VENVPRPARRLAYELCDSRETQRKNSCRTSSAAGVALPMVTNAMVAWTTTIMVLLICVWVGFDGVEGRVVAGGAAGTQDLSAAGRLRRSCATGAMQRLLRTAVWDAGAVRDDACSFVTGRLADSTPARELGAAVSPARQRPRDGTDSDAGLVPITPPRAPFRDVQHLQPGENSLDLLDRDDRI
jgi:hypothetical protein